MPTSELPTYATLFTKEDCQPCAQTKLYVFDNFYQDIADWPLLDVLTIMRKEDHPALVASFGLDLFPTLVIHQGGQMVDKVVGGKAIRGNIRYILTELSRNNYSNQ